MVQKLKHQLKNSEFLRHSFSLMTGTFMAQMIPVILSPALTRLFTPNDFGILTLFGSVSSLLSPIAALKLEHAVTVQRSDRRAFHVLVLAFAISIAFGLLAALLVFIGSFIFHDSGKVHLSDPIWWLFMPINVTTTACYQAIYYWWSRKKRFREMATNQVTVAVTSGAGRIGAGLTHMGSEGLIALGVMGQVAGLLTFVWKCFKRDQKFIQQHQWSFSKLVLGKNRRFPLYLVPSGLLQSFASQVHVLLLTYFFGPHVVGLLGLSQRVVRIPMTVVAKAIGDVFKQRASETYNRHGNCTTMYLKTFATLFVLALLPFLVLGLFSPYLFGMIFGPTWTEAGEYTQILTAMYFLQFVVSPLSNVFYVTERQKENFYLQLFLLTGIVIGIGVGYMIFGTAKSAIFMYTLVFCVKYLVEFTMGLSFSRGRNSVPN